ncbi:hypothetical protein FRX31_032746, partial [Thalictrum thalictroides]
MFTHTSSSERGKEKDLGYLGTEAKLPGLFTTEQTGQMPICNLGSCSPRVYRNQRLVPLKKKSAEYSDRSWTCWILVE